MQRTQAIQALREVGEQLARSGVTDPVVVVLGGAVAGMIQGALPPSRVTQDCDVLATEPAERWDALHAAALDVAERRGLPETWLNQDCRMFAHRLPLGWRKRCESAGRFGPLQALVISRLDLMAMKLISASARPQDLEDIVAMQPTLPECRFLGEHLDRLEAESLDREGYDGQRAILERMGRSDERT